MKYIEIHITALCQCFYRKFMYSVILKNFEFYRIDTKLKSNQVAIDEKEEIVATV